MAVSGQSVGPKDALDSWQKVYTVARRDQWLTSVWFRPGGTWFAGGKNVMVSGKDDAVTATDVPGRVVYRFGEDSAGRVIAVGVPETVWEQEGEGFRVVHRGQSPPRKGRGAYRDVLYGIGYLDPSTAETLIAYGPNDLIAYRPRGGSWATKRDETLASWALTGPPHATLPAGCRRLRWHWLARNDAVLLCHDSRVFLISNEVAVAAGRLPAQCREDLHGISRDGNNLYISCGPNQRLWLHRAETPAWIPVRGAPSGIRDLVARDGCLVLVTERQVWRWCGSSANAPR